ncbi:MAG: formimidoylglutamase [Balneolaceae bacterium]|nr:formimidoylglutamase [Balneolaceae bacterium]
MSKNKFNIEPVSDGNWSGRIDSTSDTSQFRLHQVVQQNPEFDLLKKDHVGLVGFSSDEGVRRNKGRVGASGGPEYFRKSIGSLCYYGGEDGFYDLGTIGVEGKELESAQDRLSEFIQLLLKKGVHPFVIGGGHETAFGHVAGLLKHLKSTSNESLGILNIDAHLDMRSYEEGAHSGSWALQAFELAKEMDVKLGYHAFGLNEDNNTRFLLDQARSLGATWSSNEEVIHSEKEQLDRVREFIESYSHIYCTVCLDAFDAVNAPGVSAPAWNGIALQSALNAINLVKKSGKLLSMDVCELNPKYDNGNTVRIAGSIFNAYLR